MTLYGLQRITVYHTCSTVHLPYTGSQSTAAALSMGVPKGSNSMDMHGLGYVERPWLAWELLFGHFLYYHCSLITYCRYYSISNSLHPTIFAGSLSCCSPIAFTHESGAGQLLVQNCRALLSPVRHRDRSLFSGLMNSHFGLTVLLESHVAHYT